MTKFFSVPWQKCPLQKKGWIGVEEMWCGKDVKLKNCYKAWRLGKKKLFQQWQEISPLTNDSNGQRRQYPDPKKSASLNLKAWRWGKITLAWVQILILWLQYSCNLFLKLENNSLLTLGPATPPNFVCGHGGRSQNSSQTSSLGVWFDDQVWNSISSSWRKNPLDISEVIWAHYVLAPYGNHRSNDCLANYICQRWLLNDWLTVRITLASWAERPDFSDHSLQLPASSHTGEEGSETPGKRWFANLCLHSVSIHHDSQVYSRGVKDDCTVRLGKWILRNEQVSHLSINQLILVGGIKEVKGCSVYRRLLANTSCFLSEVSHRANNETLPQNLVGSDWLLSGIPSVNKTRHKRRKCRIIKQNLL